MRVDLRVIPVLTLNLHSLHDLIVLAEICFYKDSILRVASPQMFPARGLVDGCELVQCVR